MEVYWDLRHLTRNSNSILTVGTFDGVHLGHQSLIKKLNEKCHQLGGCSTLVTFEPHPQLVVKQKKRPEIKILTTIEEKVSILSQLGLHRLIVIPFTEEFSRVTSESFIEEILVARIGFKEIVIGYDHAFGKDRKGNLEILRELGKQHHYGVEVVAPLKINGEVISSTRIRNLLAVGQTDRAAKFLGKNYIITGTVVKGNGRGKKLNFPTANIIPLSENKLIPKNGVYAALAKIGGRTYKGIMNIGVRPTFSTPKQTIEIHILNFEGDIYGEKLELELLKRIRDEIRFESTEHLVHQLELDKQESLKLLANYSFN